MLGLTWYTPHGCLDFEKEEDSVREAAKGATGAVLSSSASASDADAMVFGARDEPELARGAPSPVDTIRAFLQAGLFVTKALVSLGRMAGAFPLRWG